MRDGVLGRECDGVRDRGGHERAKRRFMEGFGEEGERGFERLGIEGKREIGGGGGGHGNAEERRPQEEKKKERVTERDRERERGGEVDKSS